MRSPEEALSEFAGLLRKSGLRVGTGEMLDALAALRLVDLASREQVRGALQATLVKGVGSLGLFGRAFDLYFAPSEIRQARREEWEQERERQEAQLRQATEELTYREKSGRTSYGPQEVRFALDRQQLLAYSRMGQEEKDRLREYIQKSFTNLGTNPRITRSVETVVSGTINYWARRLPGTNLLPLGEEDESGGEMVERVRETISDSLLTRDLAKITQEEYPKMARIIHNLAVRLGSGLERRYRSDRYRRQIDLKGTIRQSLSTGGVLFEIKYRSRRRAKPRLILLGDISGSMVKYAAFIFEFILGLSRAVPRMEFYLFAEKAERVTSLVRQNSPLETIVETLTMGSQWGGGTDLAAALREVDGEGVISRDAILVVVSDGKTRNREEAKKSLESMSRRLKDVLWLNPVAKNEWGRAGADFAKICRMFECNNLVQLERVLRRWLGPDRKVKQVSA